MEPLPRIPAPPGAVFREFRIAVLPVVVFATVLGMTVVTWKRYVGPSQLVGEVEAIRAQIAPPQSGEIAALQVRFLEQVRAGQPLAVVIPTDPRAIAAKLDLGRQRLELLRESLDARLRQQNNQISLLRLQLEWMDQRAQLASLKAHQTYFQLELDRQKQLMNWLRERARITESRFHDEAAPGSGGVSGAPDSEAEAEAETTPAPQSPTWILSGAGLERVADFQIATRDLADVNGQIREREQLVAEIERAMEDLKPEAGRIDSEMPAVVRAVLDFEDQELRAMESQVQPITLVAPMDGTVSSVLRRVGEHVLAGEIFLTISALESRQVVGYLRQPANLELTTNTLMTVRSRSRHHDTGVGRVVAIGTQMEPILPQLLPRAASPSAIEYGLPFLVSLPPGLRVIGGEVVDLHPTGP